MAENIRIDLLINAAQSAKTIGETKKALKDLKSEALNLKEGSAAFTAVATAAGELQDKISDLSATTQYLGDDLRKIKGISGIGEGIAGGFAMASGAAALFGGENKKLEESMVKLQAIMAVIQGLQAVGNVLQKESAAVLFIKNTMTKAAVMLGWQDVAATEAQTAATVAETVATEGQVVATESATIAQRLLNLAMRANPIGLLVTLILAGVSALMLWSNASSKAAEEEKKANDEKKKAAKLLKEQNEEKKKSVEYVAKESSGYITLVERLKQTNAGSKERKDLIKQINAEYGSTLKNLKDEKSFQDQLNNSVEDYIKFKEQEYSLLKNEEKVQLNQEKQYKLKEKLVELEKQLLMATVAKNAAIAGAPKDFDVNQLAAVASYNKLTAAIKSTQGELDNAKKRMTSYATEVTNTKNSMEELGFKTEDAMKKSVKSTEKATDAQKELRDAALKSQEDLIKAKGDLNEQDRKDLVELQNQRIDNMKEGFDKEKALLKQAAQEKIQSRIEEDKKEMEAYKDAYEKAISDRQALDGTSREQALQAIKKDAQAQGKTILTVEEEFSAKKNRRLESEALIRNKYQSDLKKLQIEADKTSEEEYNKWTKEEIERLYKEDLKGINEQYEKKIISFEEYTKQYEDLQKAQADIDKYWEENKESIGSARLVFEDKVAQKELDILNKKQEDGLVSEEQYQKDLYSMIEKYGAPKLATTDEISGIKIEYDSRLSFLENLVALYKEKYGEIAEIVHDTNVKSKDEQDAADKKALEERQRFWDQMIAIEAQAQELIMSVFNNGIAEREALVNREYDNKIAKIDAEKQKYDNAQAERTVSQQIDYDIQQGFENDKKDAELVRNQELDKLKKKQFNAQKINDSATIAINTGIAISKTLAELGGVGALTPIGIAILAGVATSGVVQAGIVASKEYVPSFATGGLVRGPGTGTSDSINARLSNGESVINAKSTKLFAPVLSAINEAGGGVAIPHLKNGGIYTAPVAQQNQYMDTQAIVDAIYSANERPIETYVKESAITTAQRNTQRLRNRTSF